MNVSARPIDPELVARIAATSGLPPGTALRIVEDVLAHHAESVEAYVMRRHGELSAAGWKNAAIYERLCREVAARPFQGPVCTVRQIRRMIYG